jgi:hypothetical protein
MSADGVWLYAIIPGDGAQTRIPALRGVAGEPVHLVTAGQLAAVVGAVSLAEFGQEALRRNLEDLDWVAAKARAHDAVITAVAETGSVLPVRMATVYLSDARVRELLESRQHDFAATLGRLAGRVEVGVKVYADPSRMSPVPDRDDAQPRSGTAYLMRRRRALASREEAHQAAAAASQRIHTALMRYAVDGMRKPPPDRSLSGRDDIVVLNGTYLVDRGEVESFRENVAALALSLDNLSMEITGPWPPYSFAGDQAAQ